MTRSDGIELEVVDAIDRGGGQPVARLPEAARRALGVLSGDQVVIDGASAAVATAWPADHGIAADAVGLGNELKGLIGVGSGDVIRVRTSRIESAVSVTVIVEGALDDVDRTAVLEALRHRPVWTGDRYPIDGGAVEVVDTRPTGPVLVNDASTISIRETSAGGVDDPSKVASGPTIDEQTTSSQPIQQPPGTSYDDIGGLDEELALVREMVELPLTDPELFEQLGIEPPTGVLLYGPPGTGKTLIVEALAGAIAATVYHVSGPELTSKYKGESEARLREVFERARRTAPSVVFFDEIDAIAGRREEGGDMEGRVVAQLLTLLDGLDPRGDVIVIGATNRVDALDPALRRPGRFDREIQIGVPDETGRRAILAIHTEGVPLADDIDFDRVASRTHGFVGADLKALVTEAAMATIRRVRASDGDARILVTREDIESAMASVDPSAMREVVAEIPETGFDDIGGLETAKATLREAVQWPLDHPRLFETTGTEPPTGVLLYGPPGTGKTQLARALGHESGVNVIHVRGPELLDKYVGESERGVREVFERARQVAPAIIFFDEIDAIAGRRLGEGDVTERVVSQLLTELDGLADSPNLVVLAATNRRDALDPALLRPGRLDTQIEVPIPDDDGRRAILAVHTRRTPLAADVDLDVLAARLDGATGAELAATVREATLAAVREFVDDVGLDEADRRADEIIVRGRHLNAAADAVIDRAD